MQPDTGAQVFCSGDGTVNYQSLRHGATWKDSCDVSIFELPGCDHRKDLVSSCSHCSHADSYSLLAEIYTYHNHLHTVIPGGVSTDTRMLELLSGVLGLTKLDSANSSTQDIIHDGKTAHDRLGDWTRWCAAWKCCGWLAKAGFGELNRSRGRCSLLVIVLSGLSFLACTFVLVYGNTHDYSFLSGMRWGGGEIAAEEPYQFLSLLNQFSRSQFDLGVLTYSYLGPIHKHTAQCFLQSTMILYEHDTTCTSADQNYTTYTPNYMEDGNCAVVMFRSHWLTYEINLPQASVRFFSDPECHYTEPRIECGCSASGNPVFETTFDGKPGCIPGSMTLNGTQYNFSFDLNVGWINNSQTSEYSIVKSLPPETVQEHIINSTGGDTQVLELFLRSGVPFDDGRGNGCKSVTCNSNSSALLQLYDASCSVVSSATTVAVPFNTSQHPTYFLGNQEEFFSCSDFSSRGQECFMEVADSDGYHQHQPKCTQSYYECKNIIGDDIYSQDANEPCTKGLEQAMCQDCYSAGVLTYVILGAICAIQVPLAYLSIMRTSAASDSRCAKFSSLPLALVVIVGSTLAHAFWKAQCYNHLAGRMSDITVRNNMSNWSTAVTSVEWPSYAPVFSALLAFSVLVINALTPVPEAYQNGCVDPTEIEAQPNSGSRRASFCYDGALSNSPRSRTDLEVDPAFGQL